MIVYKIDKSLWRPFISRSFYKCKFIQFQLLIMMVAMIWRTKTQTEFFDEREIGRGICVDCQSGDDWGQIQSFHGPDSWPRPDTYRYCDQRERFTPVKWYVAVCRLSSWLCTQTKTSHSRLLLRRICLLRGSSLVQIDSVVIGSCGRDQVWFTPFFCDKLLVVPRSVAI